MGNILMDNNFFRACAKWDVFTCECFFVFRSAFVAVCFHPTNMECVLLFMYFMDSEKLLRFPVFYRTLYFFVSIAPIIVIATSSPAAERREAAGLDVFSVQFTIG